MFGNNETIIYGSQGVCKITEIAEKTYDGHTKQYYTLRPLYNDTSVLYVPVDNPSLTGKMHRVLSAAEIHALIDSIPQEGALWIEDERERKIAYKEMLERGDRRELVGMIKALYLHQKQQQAKGRRLHVADEKFFKTAEKILYDEFALVLDIEPDQVLPFLLKKMHVEEKEPA